MGERGSVGVALSRSKFPQVSIYYCISEEPPFEKFHWGGVEEYPYVPTTKFTSNKRQLY